VAGAPAGIVIVLPVTVVIAVGTTLNVAVPPRHKLAFGGVTTGAAGVALTTAVAVFVQPVAESVPVTVYVVFNCGFAVTMAPVVVFKPAAGDHE